MTLEALKAAFFQAALDIYAAGCADGRHGRGSCPGPAIVVWRFYDAPEEFKRLSGHGGDEDWLALLPDDDVPMWMEGGDFGCCDVSEHRLPDGRLVVIGAHA